MNKYIHDWRTGTHNIELITTRGVYREEITTRGVYREQKTTRGVYREQITTRGVKIGPSILLFYFWVQRSRNDNLLVVQSELNVKCTSYLNNGI
jgi:hypothetical protein